MAYNQVACEVRDALGKFNDRSRPVAELVADMRLREAITELHIREALAAIAEDAGSLDIDPISRGVDILRNAIKGR